MQTRLSALKYCARDVAIVIKGWFDLVLVTWEHTPFIQDKTQIIKYSSQSQLAYHHVLHSIPGQVTLSDNAYRYARHAYFGAKVDSCMFGKLYKGPVTMWDYSSLYPSMANAKLPIGPESWKDLHIDWNNFDPYAYPPFVCTVLLHKGAESHSNQHLGVLPYHHKGSLVYLNSGHIKGVYTSIHRASTSGWF